MVKDSLDNEFKLEDLHLENFINVKEKMLFSWNHLV